MIRILVVDDHPIVHKGIKQIVEETKGIRITGEADNGHEALDKLRAGQHDVVLLDISMPGRSGLEILKEIKQKKPKLPVLILSVHPEEQYAVRALKAGASGYLTKASLTNELLAAIRKVVRGGKYVTASLSERLAFELEAGVEKMPHETLSDREYEVMLMIASGKTPTEIAKQLYLNVKTISTYRMRILEKMRLRNNVEIARYALENKLVQ